MSSILRHVYNMTFVMSFTIVENLGAPGRSRKAVRGTKGRDISLGIGKVEGIAPTNCPAVLRLLASFGIGAAAGKITAVFTAHIGVGIFAREFGY